MMRDTFHTITNGEYSELLYKLFSKERVEAELEKFLEFDFFPRVGVENFSWRNPIVPGDDLIMKVRLMVGSHRHPLWIINGSIFVGETACCYGTIKAAYKKN